MISAITIYVLMLSIDKANSKQLKELDTIFGPPLFCAMLTDIGIIAMIIKYCIS